MLSLGSPVRLRKFLISPRLRLLTSSGFTYALFPLGPESSPKNITFFCNYSINNGLFACKVHDREKSRNVTKHACIYKEGSPPNRFGSKLLLSFCVSACQKFPTNSGVSIDINRLTHSGYEM